MRTIKNIVKKFSHQLLQGPDGFCDVKVMSGPAKGTLLKLDLRLEGSYWLGTYDRWLFNLIDFSQMVQPGNIVWDCGAYVGFYTAAFRQLVGKAGKIHTFEASTSNYNRLKYLPARNGWKNVFIHNLAIGKSHSKIQFVDNMGGSSGPFGTDGKFKAMDSEIKLVEVQSAGVDELVEERGVDLPDFMKFDLETAEVFALHNGDKVFQDKRPNLLLELHSIEAKQAAGLFLERYGYSAYLIHNFKGRNAPMTSRTLLNKVEGIPHMLMCTPD